MRYLFRRKDSDNWYVRLQPPGQKVVERSLGTSDVKAAEIAATDIIKQHKQLMYQRRSTRVARVVHGPWQHEYTPGLHALADGGHGASPPISYSRSRTLWARSPARGQWWT